jgi:hypothetical protein
MRSLSFLVIAGCAIWTAPLTAQASWSLVYPTPPPPLYFNPVLACHERLGSAIRLFGNPGAGGAAAAWLFQGNSWTPATGPEQPQRDLCKRQG